MTPSGKVTEYVIRTVHVPATPGRERRRSPVSDQRNDHRSRRQRLDHGVRIRHGRSRWVVRITPAGKFTRFTAFPKGRERGAGSDHRGSRKAALLLGRGFQLRHPGPQHMIGRITTSGRALLHPTSEHRKNKQGEPTGVDASGSLITGRMATSGLSRCGRETALWRSTGSPSPVTTEISAQHLNRDVTFSGRNHRSLRASGVPTIASYSRMM